MNSTIAGPTSTSLIDGFGRNVDYVRLSVTDRCDFRCQYCMAETMTFVPREQVLSLEELTTLARVFKKLGVKKLRVTGGEPLIRKDVLSLIEALGALQFDDLCLTTNGSHLAQYAKALKQAGVDRINISLDTLDPVKFKQLTRTGNLSQVLEGLEAALTLGFKAIKLNAVILRDFNLNEVEDLTLFALSKGLDISFIEEMPLGNIDHHSRLMQFVPSSEIRSILAKQFNINAIEASTNGPARYWMADHYPGKIGFISPHSHNFCGQCNRVRLSAEGRLLLCLGNEQSVDLRAILRANDPHEIEARLIEAIVQAMHLKPEKHEFNLAAPAQILRFMNTTGG